MTDNQRTIAGRYQVKDLIGRGGMADVYEGLDVRLGRVVAIKILRADLAADSTFEARFRQEAQASARMAHPTIVRIYDAGEEQLTDSNGNAVRRPYIVMEYVRGEVLRDVINDHQLEIGEAVSYTEGVLTALEVSHRAGVIHRDIKSANIMIAENGQIKVMDFGIARAITDSSATQAHTGGIVGTAQYFSPEQAKGETVDSRTDLYSTGVLLYEMLTGRPPFRGETAVSVAYQHVSEAVVPPSKINPNLSPELDAVVLRALAKDREDRFQSADQFRETLVAALNLSRNFVPSAAPQQAQTPEPKVEAEVFGFEALLNAAVEEAVGGPIAASQAPAQEPASTTDNPYVYESRETPRAFVAAEQGSEHTNPFESIGIDFEAQVESDSRRERKSQRAVDARDVEAGFAGSLIGGPKTRTKSVLWGLIAGFVVVLLGLGVWSVSTLGGIRVSVPTSGAITVPDVSGQTYDEANTALTAAKLLVTRVYQPSDTVALDSVISIDPPAGTSVSRHTTIQVYVSSGKSVVKVPYLVNTQESNANTLLTAAGLGLGQITPQNSVDAPQGTILSSSPAEYTQVPQGSSVDLAVSTGKVTVPSVTQLSVTSAKTLLTGSDVGYSVKIQASSGTCTGTLGQIVTGQSIEPGDAKQGQEIVIYVDCIGGSTPTPTASATPTL